MNEQRRSILKGAGAASVVTVAAAAGLLKPGTVWAAGWNKAAFEAKDMAGALSSEGASGGADSGQITVKAPDIAENGAVVPVEVISAIPGTEHIIILAEKNGFPLIADFGLQNGAEGYVSTRIKMGATSNVVAVVKAGGKVYKAAKEVKVTIGGCGG
ncbi:thiosulfate oxidation carrier protein SoxY [Parasulfuritortus cantonensis]|uniref:Thiosulfate oxidation carrier protein SoxY n=1 Tax=Parasulfuritortus cantonensis TaxID=2528202 RepID=A0A4R1BF83_9PROT|nr:thiosulfate oxidation carrier protein SoxY [Parasulfuritortus cantonensis]TCJ15764.1 thiosulfate oxidation carrier protein SoxY [Parasulfuritortus cantonensis]